MHYTMVEPSCSNFRVITAKFSGVRNFRIFTVDPGSIAFAQTTVNFLNIQTPKKFVVITLKFELCGSTIE